MADMMQAGIELRPYFESAVPVAGVASDGADYASGVRDAQGDGGVRFLLSADSVEPVLLAWARLQLKLDPEGVVYVEAMGLADRVVRAAKESGNLPQSSVTDLVRRAVTQDSIRLEDGSCPWRWCSWLFMIRAR